MSLLDSMAEECRIMNHIREDDDVGSSIDYWTEGSRFMATIVKDSTTQATIAERQGISEIFTVIVKSSMALDYHDVFRRVSDGQIFRVTGTTLDNQAPQASTVRIAKVTAERWALPNA